MTVVGGTNDPSYVSRQYETEDGLAARKRAYRSVSGPDARELAHEAVLEAGPGRVLEVGCGEGELAARLTAEVRDVRPRPTVFVATKALEQAVARGG